MERHVLSVGGGAMGSFFGSLPSSTLCLPKCGASFKPPRVLASPSIGFARHPSRWKRSGTTVVTRVGPSTSSYVFAFALPISLLATTIFTSIRVADRLENDYLEELAINQAIEEAEEEEEEDENDNVHEDDDDDISLETEEPELVLPRTQNRPKR